MKLSIGLRVQAVSRTGGGADLSGLTKAQYFLEADCAVSCLRSAIQCSTTSVSLSGSTLPNGMRGVRWPRRSWISGLCAGSPGFTEGPRRLPPAITDCNVATEKPLVRERSSWQEMQLDL